MTLQKAIEIYDLAIATPPEGATPDYISMLKLGREALKRLRGWRKMPRPAIFTLLQGETEGV